MFTLGNGEMKLFAPSLSAENDCKEISCIWTFALLWSFNSCLGKHQETLFNEGLGTYV